MLNLILAIMLSRTLIIIDDFPGKDSLAMLHALLQIQRKYPIKFDIGAVPDL